MEDRTTSTLGSVLKLDATCIMVSAEEREEKLLQLTDVNNQRDSSSESHR